MIKKGAAVRKAGPAKKNKQPTQFTVQQRVMVLGPTGKRRFEWRDR